MPPLSDPIKIELTLAEALVLLEFTDRFTNTDRLEIVDQAEQRALWNLCCVLEKILTEPFIPDYPDYVARSRAELRD